MTATATGFLLEAFVAVGIVVGAAWAHELTHAVTAWLLGGRVVEIDLFNLHVDFAFEERSPARERLVLLAPGLVGLAIAPVLVLSWGGEIGIWSGMTAVAWLIYTLTGGTEGELSLQRTVAP